jgi:Helix-turn-helix domain
MPVPSIKLSVRVEEAVDLSGIGRTALYAAIRDGELVARKRGRSTVILLDDLQRYLNSLPTVQPSQKRNNFGFAENGDA